jgi:hypothetical protein
MPFDAFRPDPARIRVSGVTAIAALLAAAAGTIGHGAWSWFGDPRALTAHQRTFVGWIDGHGDVRAVAYDHRRGRIIRGPVLKRGLGRDDHNNPAFTVLPGGRLMAFFSPHSGAGLPPPGIPSRMYYRVSRRLYDVRRWGPLRVLPVNTPGPLGYTYANPLRRGRTVFLFWRGGNWLPSMSTWRRGRGWSGARTVIRVGGGNRPYVKYAPVGRRSIGMAFTQGNPGSARTSVYWARMTRGHFRRASGAPAGRLPLTPRRADRVYDGRGPGGRAWVLDTAFDPAGRPAIVFATLPIRHRVVYRYARWTGTRWRVRRIGAADRTLRGNYPGGASLDHADPSVVVLSRRVRGRFEIERWRTPDGGRTWSSTPITRRSRVDNVRPVVPWGSPAGGRWVVWMRGSYRSWTAYMTRIVLRTGAAAASAGPVRLSGPVRLQQR